ncbi:hypothetical protein IKF15_03375 [Candidatus Saccharibacteria bacterium]|nr:hypothetical protein [Candidatus Saccharibacteria bacterium]
MKQLKYVGYFLVAAMIGAVTILATDRELNTHATAQEGWQKEGGTQYYYHDGEKLRGLQKIAETYYLFDKETGAYTGEHSKQLHIGSYFQSRNYQLQPELNFTSEQYKIYFTLDGGTFHAIDDINHSTPNITNNSNSGTESCNAAMASHFRDSNIHYINGKFYNFGTIPCRAAYAGADFKYTVTENFSDFTVLKGPLTNIAPINNSSLETPLEVTRNRWAPEAFVDDDESVYVFTSIQYNEQDTRDCATLDEPTKSACQANSHRNFYIYRTKAIDLDKEQWTTPVKMNFDNWEAENFKSFIDASVFKDQSTYYMVVKTDYGGASQEKYLLYRSSDLTNWNYVDTLQDAAGGVFSAQTGSGRVETVGKATGWEGMQIIKINDTWFFYTDHYVWDNENLVNNTTVQYDGIYHYATSDDLRNWDYGGKTVNAGLDTLTGKPNFLRHGSLSLITENAGAKLIQQLYNGADIPALTIEERPSVADPEKESAPKQTTQDQPTVKNDDNANVSNPKTSDLLNRVLLFGGISIGCGMIVGHRFLRRR